MGVEKKIEDKISLVSAIFLGLGSMVGAGIFALLGEAGSIAGNRVYISFIIGGFIALLSGYSFAKFSQRYPSRGGIIEYLTQSYGEGFFSGFVSILFYLSSMIAIAMVAKTFGIYSSNLFGFANTNLNHNIFSIFLLIFLVIINLTGLRYTVRLENGIVFFKLIILLILGVISYFFIKPENLINNNYFFNDLNVFYAIGLTFFAYEGFRVITNTIEDLENPKENIIKAMMYSILLVMGLYVVISIGVFGNFSLSKVIEYKEYVLAEVAKNVLGSFGFVLIAITALISTASSVNANLYGISNVTYTMAKKGELPKQYSRRVYHSFEGLIITSILLILMLIFFNLAQIAIIGSISILIIHFLVHIGHLMRIKETGANLLLIILAIFGSLIIAILVIDYSIKNMDNIIQYLVVGVLIAFLLEVFLRMKSNRVVRKQIKFKYFKL